MRVTAEQYRKMKPKKPKYQNKKVTTEDGVFDSQLEAGRYFDLRMLERAGHISDLRRQVKFLYEVNGEIAFTWIADFCYKDEGGNEVTEDVKALSFKDGKPIRPTCTPVYRLKKKLIEAHFGIKIFEYPEAPKTVRRKRK